MNIRFAQWMEKDDRCLYLCATRLRVDLESGKKKDISEAETIILKDFLGNYLVVRLTNMFFLDVSSPVLTLLNFLETEEPLIYKRWDMMAELFYDIFSKFMKSDRAENILITELLDVVFTDSSLQHSDTEIFLGAKVEAFIKELGFNRQSTEIKPWLEKVREFYIEALQKIVKYFKPSLTSRTLRDMDLFNPKSIFSYSLDDLKKKYKYVAKKFPNIIKPHQIPDLLDQVTKMKFHKKIEDATNELNPTEFFAQLANVEGSKFEILADPKPGRTKQLRLQARLKVRINVHNLRYKCKPCGEVRLKKWRRQSAKNDTTDDTDDE